MTARQSKSSSDSELQRKAVLRAKCVTVKALEAHKYF